MLCSTERLLALEQSFECADEPVDLARREFELLGQLLKSGLGFGLDVELRLGLAIRRPLKRVPNEAFDRVHLIHRTFLS
jgi:hypothetical protein